MATTYDVDDTFGLSAAAGAYVHESRRSRSVKRFEVTEPPLSPGFRWGGCGRDEKGNSYQFFAAISNCRADSTAGRGLHGIPGLNGADGGVGPQGPPFAAAVVDSTTTLDPGNSATVGVSFDGSNVRFTFGIPRGVNGTNGTDGGPGPQGTPGEVTNAALTTAIAGTSSNSNTVTTLDNPFTDPDVDTLRQKLYELILNGRR